MPIQDSSPERRNLTVTAASIIIFYIAGAKFDSQEIRLQLINVHFTNASILTITIWTLLCWFVFRYWQQFKGTLSTSFNKNVISFNTKKLCNWYLIKHHKINIHKESGCSMISNLAKIDKRWVAKYKFVTNISLNDDGSFHSYTVPPDLNDEEKNVVVLGFLFKLILFPFFLIKMFLIDSEFVSILMPYLLFSAAVILGIYSKFN